MDPRQIRTTALPALAVAMALAVGACEGSQGETGELTEAVEESGPAADADRPAGEEEPEPEGTQALLESRGGSGVSGTVAARRLDGRLRIRVRLENADPDARYLGHLHRGACDEPGRQVIPLEPFTRTPDGATRSETTIEASRLDAGTRHLVQVHGSEHAVVACGSLPDASVPAEAGSP